jgi:hypothetical protein
MSERTARRSRRAGGIPATSRRSFRVLSFAFTVESSSPGFSAAVDRVFGAFAVRAPRGAPTYAFVGRTGGSPGPCVVERDGVVLASADDSRECLDFLVWHVLNEAVGGTDGRLLVHAGAASLGERGVILPGASSSGKSTLVAGLVRAGFRFLSDEVGVLDMEDGRLLPFPRALSLSAPSLDLLGGLDDTPPREVRRFLGEELPVPPDELRRGSVGGPAPVRAVVAPRYRNGARTRLERVTRAAGLADLAGNAFNLEAHGRHGIALLAHVVAGARCYRLRVGDDLGAAVDAVRSALAVDDSGDEDGEGEHLSIDERVVVSPAWGTFHGEPLDEGRRVEPGTVIGSVGQGPDVTSLVAHSRGRFLAWLVREGEWVAPGRPVARLRAEG